MSEETNVDVTTTEQTDGNYHSFDDLDSMSSESPKELIKEAQKEVKESKSENIKDLIKEAQSENSPSENDKQTNSQEIGDQIEAELVQEIKKLEAKFGEERYEIPQEAKISVKIDGEEQEISLTRSLYICA